ncbi:MAG: hypothetical protein WD077_03245 [Bacteroidia bacterium]
MKYWTYFISSFVLLAFSSCKKCKTCQSWQNGVVTEEKNCAYGGGSSNQTLENWELYLVEEAGYDSVSCVTE